MLMGRAFPGLTMSPRGSSIRRERNRSPGGKTQTKLVSKNESWKSGWVAEAVRSTIVASLPRGAGEGGAGGGGERGRAPLPFRFRPPPPQQPEPPAQGQCPRVHRERHPRTGD